MTVALVAASSFGGNHRLSAAVLAAGGYMRRTLSPGRFCRRLHAIPEAAWLGLFALLAGVHRQMNAGQEYAVDSMPVPVCDNIRIKRCRLYRIKRCRLYRIKRCRLYRIKRCRLYRIKRCRLYRAAPAGGLRGYLASRRCFFAHSVFYGLRVHLVVTVAGRPVEFALAAGSEADTAVFRRMALDLPPGARVFADAAYLDRQYAGLLSEAAAIDLTAQRRGNSRDPLPPWVSYLCDRTRKRIETTLSGLRAALAGGVHAVTPRGFELKVALTVIAYAINA